MISALETALVKNLQARLFGDFTLIHTDQQALATLYEIAKLTGLEREYSTAYKKHIMAEAEKIFS